MLRSISIFNLGLVLFAAANVFGTEPTPSSQSSERNDAQLAAQIRAVIQAQQEAWNRGDIEAFMNGYARSDSTLFVSGDTVTRGWLMAREHYKITYNNRAKMGTLRFSDLEIQPLSNDAAIVLGRWMIKRATKDNPHGHFTLVFQRTSEGWRIIHDHTSTAASQ